MNESCGSSSLKGHKDDASIASIHTILLDKFEQLKVGMKIWKRFVPQDLETGLSASLIFMIAKELQVMLMWFL